MLKVRLARFGQKKRPFFHVVVTNSEKPRNGRFIEQLGNYDPSKPDASATLNLARYAHWLKIGAKPSERVEHIVRRLRAATGVVAAVAVAKTPKQPKAAS